MMSQRVRKVKVAAIQINANDDLNKNLEVISKLIFEAAELGAKIVVLPEDFSLFSFASLKQGGAEEYNIDSVKSFLREAARTHRLIIVSGTIPVFDPDKRKSFSTSFVFDEYGEEIGSYNKCHLFDAEVADKHGVYRESDYLLPGEDIGLIETSFGKLGIGICYDLRFPEYFRLLAKHHVDLLVLPAAFTKATGKSHWEVLTRARAIENVTAMVAANQYGTHWDGKETYGHSCIVDCRGRVLELLESGEGVVYADIDFDKQKKDREAMPCTKHARFI